MFMLKEAGLLAPVFRYGSAETFAQLLKNGFKWQFTSPF